MSGNIMDTEFFNRLNDQASKDAFHLLRKKMFEAKAEEAEAKAQAEVVKAEAAKVKAEAAKAEAEKQAVLIDNYFTQYTGEFLTDNLMYAGKARVAAEAAGLRFSSYLETEVNGSGNVVAVKIKCVARIPKKK